ncbi:MAG: twitching motility two-component response regulator transcription regulator protein [Pseudomonadota bacterium]|jgi:twitching motility two-component system response regulator PilH
MNAANILVVDDSPTDRHFLADLLTRHGYSVTTADNGESALLQIRSKRPDLVLMDVVMPGQNGFHATREIARDPATQGLPIIICSSKQQESDRAWGLRQGARDYLVKPIDPVQLLQKIAGMLGESA